MYVNEVKFGSRANGAHALTYVGAYPRRGAAEVRKGERTEE